MTMIITLLTAVSFGILSAISDQDDLNWRNLQERDSPLTQSTSGDMFTESLFERMTIDRYTLKMYFDNVLIQYPDAATCTADAQVLLNQYADYTNLAPHFSQTPETFLRLLSNLNNVDNDESEETIRDVLHFTRQQYTMSADNLNGDPIMNLTSYERAFLIILIEKWILLANRDINKDMDVFSQENIYVLRFYADLRNNSNTTEVNEYITALTSGLNNGQCFEV